MEEKNKSLFEFTREYMEAFNNVDVDENGELIGLEALEAIKTEEFIPKAGNVAKWIRSLESQLDAIKEQKKIFGERQKAKENEIEKWKNYLKFNLLQVGLPKFETAEVSVKLGRVTQSIEISDKFMIPESFMRQVVTKEPDKAKIKEAIEQGEIVAGASIVEHQNVLIK